MRVLAITKFLFQGQADAERTLRFLLLVETLGNRVVSMGRTIGGMALFFAGFAGICYGVQYPVGWVVSLFPAGSEMILALLVFVAYVALLWLASKTADLEPDDPNAAEVERPVAAAGSPSECGSPPSKI